MREPSLEGGVSWSPPKFVHPAHERTHDIVSPPGTAALAAPYAPRRGGGPRVGAATVECQERLSTADLKDSEFAQGYGKFAVLDVDQAPG